MGTRSEGRTSLRDELFHIALPLTPAPAIAPSTHATARTNAPEKPLNALCVWVAEDNLVNQRLAVGPPALPYQTPAMDRTLLAQINNWLTGKTEVTSDAIFKQTTEALKKQNPDAGFMFETHRDIS